MENLHKTNHPQPVIDILMATYNGEKYIREQIQSILDQKYKNIKLIISDDCSTDNTVSIIKSIAQKDSRIILLKNNTNKGYIKNFEYLIEYSSAEYIMLSDQDDVWKKDKIKKSFNYLLQTKSDLVFSDLTVVDENLNKINRSFNKAMHLHPEKLKSYKDLFHRNHGTGSTFLFKSKMKQYILPFIDLKTKEYIHDWYILFECFYNGNVSYLNESSILYRQHKDNQIGLSKNKHTLLCHLREKRKKYISDHYEFISKFKKKNYDVQQYIEYIKSLEKTRFINLKFKLFLSYMQTESLMQKLKLIIVLHFPIIFIFCNKEK